MDYLRTSSTVESKIHVSNCYFAYYNILFQIFLPQLLLWYKQDFAGDNKTGDFPHEGLVNFIASQSSEELASRLRNLIRQHALHLSGSYYFAY